MIRKRAIYMIDPIRSHIRSRWTPSNAMKAHKLWVRALKYALIDNKL